MSIRPVDFNGMIQNTTESSIPKVTEEARMNAAQQNVQVTVDKQDQSQTSTVHQSDNAEQRQDSYEEGGDGTGYMGNWNRRKKNENKEKKKSSDGSVTVKTGHQPFDVSI